MDIALIATGKRGWMLQGELTFQTVPKAWQLISAVLEDQPDVRISLEQVSRNNSAALGLLLEARRYAKANKREVSFDHIPDEITALARMSNVEKLI